jgi:hypothetical protein
MTSSSKGVDFEFEERVRTEAALRILDFESWAVPAREGDSFSEIPWLDIVTTASIALLAVDKHLKAADGIVDRLSRLYKWIVKKEEHVKSDKVTLSERIIVLLANQLAVSGPWLSANELAAETMHSVDDVERELKRLKELSIATEKKGRWTLRISTI